MKTKFIIGAYCTIFILMSMMSGCKDDDTPSPGDPPVTPPGEIETPDYAHIFEQRTNGYSCYRIPAIVKTTKGTLLAFAEARIGNCNDEGQIDLVLRRSDDNGKTWGDMIVVWSDGANTCGNPAPVVDQNTGRVHLLMTWNLATDAIGTINNGTSTDTRRVFVTNSDDDGLSWKAPREITSDVKPERWGWYATGPCHGMQIANGTYKGRLVIPCDNIELKSYGGRGFSHVIYSDDAGETWQLGGVTPHNTLNPNESTVAELSNGDLLLNMRCSNNNNLRLTATSSDGGISWSPVATAYGFIDPVCQGSLLSADINGTHTLFFSNPASVTRDNLTLKMSTDDGRTWPKIYNVYTGPSGYSDIVIHSDTQVGVLYETGTSGYRERIAYQIVDIADFK